MSLKFFSILALLFFISCSTTPIKYDKPIKANDYKNYYQLKEEKDNPVSKKSIGQKIKETFTRKPKVKTLEVEQAKTNKVEIKKSRPLKRRVRQTNTNPVTDKPGKLMSMATRDDPSPPRDIGKTIMLYLIYLQSIIIAIFAFVIFRRQKKSKNTPSVVRELNL